MVPNEYNVDDYINVNLINFYQFLVWKVNKIQIYDFT